MDMGLPAVSCWDEHLIRGSKRVSGAKKEFSRQPSAQLCEPCPGKRPMMLADNVLLGSVVRIQHA